MKTYIFRYDPGLDGDNDFISVKFEAKDLSSALKLFWLECKNFPFPIKRLCYFYEVINEQGKRCLRMLKDKVKVLP